MQGLKARKKSSDSNSVRLNNVGLFIFQAASSGKPETLESAFNTIPQHEVQRSINYVEKKGQGMTPLMIACKRGNLRCVKFLLYHGADIQYTIRPKLHTLKAAHIARRAGHVHIEQYLKKCQSDLDRFGSTRASLEMSIEDIATKSYSSLEERERFDLCLERLILSCDYSLSNSVVEDAETIQPLIIKAARADNIQIVIKLITNYQVSEQTHDCITAETLMHIACQNLSKLRFYLVKHYPGLMRKRDVNGVLPLHIACDKNDIQFISWLFGNILATDNGDQIDLEFEESIMRVRSHSDLLSPSISIPPNRSLQSIVPMSPVILTSPKSSLPPAVGYHSLGGSGDGYDEIDGDQSDQLQLLAAKAREQGTLRSYEVARSFTMSVSGSSRSGSSERSLSKSKSNHSNFTSSDEADGGIFFSHIKEETNKCPETHLEPCIKGIREENPDDSKPSSPSYESEINAFLHMEDLIFSHPLTIQSILDMKPFSIAVNGDSIFHILARKGLSELLNIIVKVADFLKRQVDLSVLTHRDGFSSRLPIEEAIYNKSHECVQVLIRLAMVAGQMPVLLQDPHILRGAIITNNIRLVKILIANGFHKGLKPAISLAIISEFNDILRLLLYWQTQVVNSVEFSRVASVRSGKRVRGLDKGAIKWSEIQLEVVQPQWLIDSCNAVISVARLLRLSSITSDITEHDFEYFKTLGKGCLEYFNSVSIHSNLERELSLAPITDINMSENQLRSIPMELFQMPSLLILHLSHNDLRELPSSDKLSVNIYTSNLIKLDLDWNKLKELPEDMFRGLAHSLRELSVQNNRLESLPPGLWVMPNLKKIKLSHNSLDHLHYFSRACYFDDHEISKSIVSSYDTAEETGELICTSPNSDSADMQQCTDYLKKLAMFYHTVCTARCPQGTPNISTVYQEMISIHLMRYVNLPNSNNSSIQEEWTPPAQESAKILNVFEDEEFESVQRCTMDLEILDLSHNKFSEFPWDLACIAPKLMKLDMRGNMVSQFDIVHSTPRHIVSLILSKNALVALNKDRSLDLPCGNPLRLLCMQDDTSGNNYYCQHCNHPSLDKLTNLILDCNNLSYFPIVDTPRVESSEFPSDTSGFEMVHIDPYYPDLSILSLAYNNFMTVPKNLHHLVHLSSLTLSHNKIVELPLDMGLMNASTLLLLRLEGLYLRNVPESLLQNNRPKQLLCHLKALKQKSRPYRRMKLMVVGAANKGKTSLLLNLVKRGKMKRFTEVERGVNDLPLSTVGVELGDWEYSHLGKPKVTFMTWDFGGQEEYYATHQCFITRRSLYLLVWNVQDGEEGLRALKPWLENIEGKAPRSPVIVIGTHIDLIPQANRSEVLARLQNLFRTIYITNSHRKYTYPRIEEDCQFINVNSARQVDSLRDSIYEFSIKYKVKGPYTTPNCNNNKPLLDEAIPESYLVLQDFIRETAEKCIRQKRKPILTKKEYIRSLRESEYSDRISEIDVDQATSFLHDSGILLHFEDSSLLNDLYFINPQWLCTNLAKLITVREYNPFQRLGFMLTEDVKKIYPDCFEEFIILMQKFEVVLIVDENHILIPSLLPQEEKDACLIFDSSISFSTTNTETFDQLRHEPHASMYETPHPIFTRYYLLPFVPNGLFSRLVARLMSSDMINHLQQSLINNKLGKDHIINDAHWKCWRKGILITWSHMEIFRIAPLSSTLAGTSKVAVVIKKDSLEYMSVLKGIEIKVSLLPEEYIEKCSTLEGQLSASTSFRESDSTQKSRGKCLATWLLQKATSIVDSVFEDWYESFARKKGFDPHQENVKIANPCNKCSSNVQDALLIESRKQNHSSSSSSSLVSSTDADNVCYIFTSPYVALASDNGERLECPKHGSLDVCDVAPDLMFNDFLPGTVFTDHSSLVLREELGDGGFGTVYRATLHTGGRVETVASKQFTPGMGFLEEDAEVIAQLKTWDVYQKASVEARVMHQLSHPNILGLIGIAFHPLSLLVELAPEGDLKKAVERFKKDKVLLSRRTLKCTLIQVAEALNYLHSRQFIYRDLKPENVLVWKYPRPETQWIPDVCVFVKLADYGISKQITPQGIRGVEGTRPYLPPEVILHGGREAYSTKLDVYGYGMFMYFLVSFRTPFDSGRPITSLLEEGKRPELSPKRRPRAIKIFELMCWCWSESPRHRPSFSTILQILKEDSFTNLLASFPLIGNEEVITCSCVRSFRTRRISLTSTSYRSHNAIVDQSLASVGAMSLVHGKSLTSGEEYATQVWYGTELGKCGVVQFQNSGITHDMFELPQQKTKYISIIQLISGHIWVATVGYGLFIYNPNNKEVVSRWGVEDRYKIYAFFEIPEKQIVLLLTQKGMFVFDSDTDSQENLVPKYKCPKEKEEMTIGMVIPRRMTNTEIWVTSQSSRVLSILDTTNFSVIEQVELITSVKDDNTRMKVRHMETVDVKFRLILAVANKQFIYMVDVEERKSLPAEFDCEEICAHLYDPPKRNYSSGVTALSSKAHFLYAAVRGGAILCLNCQNMEVVHIFDAYLKPARSLLMINYSNTQSKPFSRLFSRTDLERDSLIKSTTSLQETSAMQSVSVSGSYARRRLSQHSSASSFGNESFNDEDVASNSVLISFGGGYKGVVKGEEFPENFILPSEGNKTCNRSSLPDKAIGHLLLWSTETGFKAECTEECNFDEAEELTLLSPDLIGGT